ncbi:amidohydrolase family protein [Pseudofrankia asymbiotica]|uniref:amidohydrolase family protein n=1 Tax=Pseudofrankia asymbiotica TaxID=1834516 RepID=UPI000976AA11|nr:amidohydrolase family protein [Pseudofrankia asymbiotica]
MRHVNDAGDGQAPDDLDVSANPNRRTAVLGAAALGAAALTPTAFQVTSAAAADPPSADTASSGTFNSAGRIDVHQHANPPASRQWLIDHGLLPPSGGPPWAQWDLASTLQIMDQTGVAAAVLSGPVPAEFLSGLTADLIREMTRIGNDGLAEVVRSQPKRFGFFAYLPLTQVDIALEAAAYALDTLKADGVSVNMHAAGLYLGDPSFDPVLAELNRRKAVVFTHPFNLAGCGGTPVAEFLVDFLADTTRAAVKMVLAGTLTRFPDIRWILPHGGGFFPYMAGRLQLGTYLGAGVDEATAVRALKRFYYDTAMPTSPHATPSLLAAAGADRILYGSDWPAATADGARLNARAIDTDPFLDAATRRRVNRENAQRLLPALARRMG